MSQFQDERPFVIVAIDRPCVIVVFIVFIIFIVFVVSIVFIVFIIFIVFIVFIVVVVVVRCCRRQRKKNLNRSPSAKSAVGSPAVRQSAFGSSFVRLYSCT